MRFDAAHFRPKHLSDPHDEFLGSADRLLAIPDVALQWNHFRDLLGPYFPAGTYEEVVYFLPLALEHLIAREESALDLVTTPIWFASEYDERLRRDGIRNAVRDRIRDCFAAWTSEFCVVHFDESACRAKGWGILYSDYVKFSETICQGMEDLVRLKSHADLAIEFFRSLTKADANPVKSAWFLYFSRAQAAVYPPPNDPTIRELLNNQSCLSRAAESVRNSIVPTEGSPTYWRDIFAELNL